VSTDHSRLLKAIDDFRNHRIEFSEYKAWIIGSAGSLGYDLGYEGDWYNDLDSWLEYIEFCYAQEDWHELGCSLGDFIEVAIKDETKPLRLPVEDRVVREQILKLA
jgi:hypothetical protein